jgi:hypothetical protein
MAEFQIIKNDPIDWRMLQHDVSTILRDCGYEADTEKTIETVRGKVEVDVFATKKKAYTSTVLCECKYWNTAVPQTVIHAFRTVVEDSGASQGIIISKTGFQKGAFEAVAKSNLVLLTWQEFQNAFSLDYVHHVVDRNFKKGHELRIKVNLVLEIYHKNPFVLSNKEFDDFQLLREAHNQFLFYSFREHYEHLDTREISLAEVNRGIAVAKKDLKIDVNSLKEYFDYIFMMCEQEILKVASVLAIVQDRKKDKNE